MDFHQIGYMHLYCRDLPRDFSLVNFMLSARGMIEMGYYRFTVYSYLSQSGPSHAKLTMSLVNVSLRL